MLEGLEISEVPFSYVLSNNKIFRIDSNFFQKKFICAEQVIREKKSTKLASIGVELRSFGAYSLNNQVNYLDEGVPFIRGVNMKKGRVSFSNLIYIDEEAHSLLWKSEVRPGMVLLSMSGTVGDVAIASKKWKYPINSNQDIAKIDTKGKINPYFLFAFLLSKFGQNYLLREARGSVQQHVFLSQIENFEIPRFASDFNFCIQSVIEESDDILSSSEDKHNKSEELLLGALGLVGFSLCLKSENIKSFKNSFVKTGRLDAEHYQLKYDQINSVLSEFFGGVTTVGDLAEEITNGAEVREYQEQGVPYLRIGDLKFLDVEASSVVFIDPNSAEKGLGKIGLQAGDVLLSRSGSLAVSAVVEPAWENALISSHLIRLRIRDARIDPYFLALFFMTLPGKMQIQKWSNGGVQPEISQPAVKEIIVPILPLPIQHEIRRLILEARRLRSVSEKLLEAAKRAVEIAIEQDEAAGMAYLAAEKALA